MFKSRLKRLARLIALLLALTAAAPRGSAPPSEHRSTWHGASTSAGCRGITPISSGILKKWADKYGIKIKLTQINDYVESINQYTAGQFDACVMTNMDMLTIPAAGGVDSTALIVGDFSNGNDGVVLKGRGRTLADIKGQKINLVELSVSHYLLVRALGTVGLRERDMKVVNTSDADIVARVRRPAHHRGGHLEAAVERRTGRPNAQLVFDSSKIPGEILDLMVVNTATLAANPKLGKALVGAWYETLALMLRDDAAAKRRPGGHGQGLRHRSAGFEPARDHAPVRHAGGSLCVHLGGCARQDHGSGAAIFLRSRHARAGRGQPRCGRHPIPRGQGARRPGQFQDALRLEIHPRWPRTAQL